MISFKKQFFLVLFILSAAFFVSGSAGAQTWTEQASGNPNPCGYGSGSTTQCTCNQGWTYGKANLANCTMDGFIPGCWNPSNGKCNTCGEGGTVSLGSFSCFSGQSSQGGYTGTSVGIACTPDTQSMSFYSPQCTGAGSSGGQAQ